MPEEINLRKLVTNALFCWIKSLNFLASMSSFMSGGNQAANTMTSNLARWWQHHIVRMFFVRLVRVKGKINTVIYQNILPQSALELILG